MAEGVLTSETAPIERITLERIQFHVQAMASLDMLDQIQFTPKFDSWIEHTAQSMVLSMRTEVLGQRLMRVDESYPSTWWDAVKLRFYPKWALKRWPSRMTHITVDAHALYPTIAPIPDHSPYMHIQRFSGTVTLPE